MLLASAGGGAVEEMETVAYYVDRTGYEGLVTDPEDNPFTTKAERLVAPVRLEKKPNGTRFFADGDRMWLLTGTLRQQKVLRNERSWAVWNEGTERLVVRGTVLEHRAVGRFWQGLMDLRLMQVEVGLVKVRCGELGAVDWTEDEVRKRRGVRLGTVAVRSRQGQVATVERGAGKMRMEVEPFVGSQDQIMDLRLAFSADVQHGNEVRRLELKTGLVVLAGQRVYHEVGGADGGAETYLVSVEGEVQFMNGLPVRQWREFESPERKEAFFKRDRMWGVLGDGTRISRWAVPPTFLKDVFPGESDPTERAEWAPLKFVMDFPGLDGGGRVHDLREFMEGQGLVILEKGWVCYRSGSSTLVARLDEENTGLLAALVGGGGPLELPRLIHTTVSVIEWEGKMESGRIPAGARRLGRVGAVGRPGQKMTLRHGSPADQLKRGVSLGVESVIGANNRVVDVRIDVEMAGGTPVKTSTGLTMNAGTAVVVPLGEDDGKKLGVVVECRIIDGTGREVGR